MQLLLFFVILLQKVYLIYYQVNDLHLVFLKVLLSLLLCQFVQVIPKFQNGQIWELAGLMEMFYLILRQTLLLFPLILIKMIRIIL